MAAIVPEAIGVGKADGGHTGSDLGHHRGHHHHSPSILLLFFALTPAQKGRLTPGQLTVDRLCGASVPPAGEVRRVAGSR
jgi:hypothetical protein